VRVTFASGRRFVLDGPPRSPTRRSCRSIPACKNIHRAIGAAGRDRRGLGWSARPRQQVGAIAITRRGVGCAKQQLAGRTEDRGRASGTQPTTTSPLARICWFPCQGTLSPLWFRARTRVALWVVKLRCRRMARQVRGWAAHLDRQRWRWWSRCASWRHAAARSSRRGPSQSCCAFHRVATGRVRCSGRPHTRHGYFALR